jgi:5-enolpyruvylshikimate-3-phosphate synthase
MSSIHKRTAKHAVLPLVAWAAAAALAAMTALPASAQERATRIVIDKDTKRARMAEHDEIAAAKSGASARSAAPNATGSATFQTVPDAMLHGQPINARFGARGHRTDEKRMSFTVINRNPDGTWSTQCLAGETAAQHAMHSKPTGGANDR